ncbi:hypothetical protein PR202_gb25016 [Eleusine coracana subsp. coracana]|uniref:Uncharacterized protein n=1 Tax=Eleusine coracana subsp. coracana TaxID=191504 RepID=A0AAV5FMF8_ELECO|nr:hypothetical protein PR202_gb25016 [Eleusine coracana subsp. coracana]
MRKGFNSFVMLVAWCLWKQRNRGVFDSGSPDMRLALDMIAEEAKEWVSAGAKKLARLLR